MSLEAWGDEGPESIDVEALYRKGWECNEDATLWWRVGEPETTYTIEQAADICFGESDEF